MATSPPDVEKQAKALVANYKQRLLQYFNGFQSSDNKKLLRYVSDFVVHPERQVQLIVQFPVDEGNYEPVPVTFTCPTRVDLKLMGLSFRELSVEALFPGILFGPASAIPRLVFRAPTPRSWPGHVGLYFDPHDPKDVGLYPYERAVLKRKEIKAHHDEGVLDGLCDFLNNYDAAPSNAFRRSLSKIFTKTRFPAFYYRSYTNRDVINVIHVPIYLEYDQAKDESWMVMETYASKDYWMQPQTVALEYFEHLAEATNYFDDEGNLFEDGPHPPTWTTGQGGAAERQVVKRPTTKVEVEANPFREAKRVERDAMGFVIRSATGEFALDATEAEKRRVEEQRRLQREREQAAKAAAETIKPPVDLHLYRDANDWYERNSTRQFTLRGTPEALSFKDRADFRLLESFNPPFMLQFLRDHVKIKKQLLTSTRASQFLFDCYKKGFLVPLA
ncbi:MAG: hypothetical protein Kow0069_33840 [Promethearchaeota archaeon]